MWQRTGPLATPVPIVHAFPRATAMSTTGHTTYRSGRSVKLPRRVESIPTGVHLDQGGDYGHDEAHDFSVRRSTET